MYLLNTKWNDFSNYSVLKPVFYTSIKKYR